MNGQMPIQQGISTWFPQVLNGLVIGGVCSRDEAVILHQNMTPAAIDSLAAEINQREMPAGTGITEQRLQEILRNYLANKLSQLRQHAQQYTQYHQPPSMYSNGYVPNVMPPAAMPVYGGVPQMPNAMGGMMCAPTIPQVGYQNRNSVIRNNEAAAIATTLPELPKVVPQHYNTAPMPVQPSPIPVVEQKAYTTPASNKEATNCSIDGVIHPALVRMNVSTHQPGTVLYAVNASTDLAFATPFEAADYVKKFTHTLMDDDIPAANRKYMARLSYTEPMVLDVPHAIFAETFTSLKEFLHTDMRLKPLHTRLSEIEKHLDNHPSSAAKAIRRLILTEFFKHIRANRLVHSAAIDTMPLPALTDGIDILKNYAPNVEPALTQLTSAPKYVERLELVIQECINELIERIVILDPRNEENTAAIAQAFGNLPVMNSVGDAKTLLDAVLSKSNEHHSLVDTHTMLIIKQSTVYTSNILPVRGSVFDEAMSWSVTCLNQYCCDLEWMLKDQFDIHTAAWLVLQPQEPAHATRMFLVGRTIDDVLSLYRRSMRQQ